MRFEITVTEDGNAVRVTVTGELDLATAPELERTLDAVEQTSAATIVLDLDGVDFLDSTGLRVVLGADARSQANGSRLAVTRGSPQVQWLFRLVGADTRMTFAD